MKKCIFCKRSVMGKRILGMCPKCFYNFIQILLIIMIVLFINIIIPFIAFITFIPVSAFIVTLFGFGGITAIPELFLDIIVIGCCIFGALVGLGLIVFLIVRLVLDNRKI